MMLLPTPTRSVQTDEFSVLPSLLSTLEYKKDYTYFFYGTWNNTKWLKWFGAWFEFIQKLKFYHLDWKDEIYFIQKTEYASYVIANTSYFSQKVDPVYCIVINFVINL